MLFNIEPMPDPREDLTCPECGKALVETVAGNYSTCPDWCSGLHPKLSDVELSRTYSLRIKQ